MAKISRNPRRATPQIAMPRNSEQFQLANTIREIIEVHERRKGDVRDSFVRVGELEELGLVRIVQGEVVAATPATILTGEGTPQGNVEADVGAIFLRTDGGTSTTLYVKESDSGKNTGWVAK